jgi:excisionase family DNA binding protein
MQQIGQSALISYDAAAALLGVQRTSVKQLVQRGHLHSVPAPEDRRRRKLLFSEVQAYAQSHAGKWRYPMSVGSVMQAQAGVPVPPTASAVSPTLVKAGVVSAGASVALIAAFRMESDVAIRLLIVGALVGLALVLFLEWQRQGKLDDAQKRRLEKLAKQAEAMPEAFVNELDQLIAQVS